MSRSERLAAKRQKLCDNPFMLNHPSTPPANGSPFRDLPAEIRINIYKILSKDAKITIMFACQTCHCGDVHEPAALTFTEHIVDLLGLLSCCSLIRKEAWPVLAQQTLVKFEGLTQWDALPDHLSTSFLPNVKKIVLTVPYLLSDPGLLEKLPQLKQVEVIPDFSVIFRDAVEKFNVADFIPHLFGANDKEYLDLTMKVASGWVGKLDADDEDDYTTNEISLVRSWGGLQVCAANRIPVKMRYLIRFPLVHLAEKEEKILTATLDFRTELTSLKIEGRELSFHRFLEGTNRPDEALKLIKDLYAIGEESQERDSDSDDGDLWFEGDADSEYSDYEVVDG
ncbi:uncharacterized protein AB675_1255 [Cyphellophora attinorum]|uniref:Uncharacterized protein n=1 Tax=Cyphellophora attinorum TaxID=1664694 RepID=A0A0N1HM25_9EURO|nr:uncharacterized protein AB675_1255 [Phialophora attinorum]KPI35716.1 hypothetical protein AB675_1255 [Phialophora attinorum]